jgi:GT2 family glycosyltransferase
MMTAMPVAGVVWQNLHYMFGFERLGFDVYYLEVHGRTPSMLMRSESDDSTSRAAAFLERTLRRYGFPDRWAYHALHDQRQWLGVDRAEIRRVCESAEMILNLHGGTRPTPELAATDRLVYLETDPVELQVELEQERQETIDVLAAHAAFFTFAENWKAADCLLPRTERFGFEPTRQPVVVDLWQAVESRRRRTYTTVGNWRQNWRQVKFHGDTLSWSKHDRFLRYLELPSRVNPPLELALSACSDEERERLREHGWRVRDAAEISDDPDAYRAYIVESYGEFTVAKQQNVQLRTGWFSDRSATYLAAGLPVITEETGFSNVLPTGEGLFGFSTTDEAQAAIEDVESDYPRHRRAATEIARERFSHEVVLGDLLGRLGIPIPIRRRRARPGLAIPRGTVLTPVSRRPLRLPDPTVRAAMRRPIPRMVGPAPAQPPASVVVVTRDNLAFTRLCMASLLANTLHPEYEVVVVDNGSRDGTAPYLADLGSGHARVRVVLNGHNAGFPAACNQGIAIARADHLVLLNNDTMVPPGWLARLVAHLGDPDVALVGPLTNRIGTDAEVTAGYRTWGEFLGFAARRARDHAGESSETLVLALFCAGLRREVYEQLGPLDEAFGVGLLEDDDYSARAREAGYRLCRAEDVVVHHFGEASFGKLIPQGEYMRVLRRNQQLFAEKWGTAWQPYIRRRNEAYTSLRRRLRELVEASVPPDSTVAVVSRGDDELLRFERRRGVHFPQSENGRRYAGHYPADSDAAVAQLQELRASGANFLCIPQGSAWWLDHYGGLRAHLEERCRRVAAKPGVGTIFELKGDGA